MFLISSRVVILPAINSLYTPVILKRMEYNRPLTPQEVDILNIQKHETEEHTRRNSLRDVILGGQDGLVNAMGIILGIIAAGGDNHILIATVLAATFAESLSMGAVAYTSAISQKSYYESERRREMREIKRVPEIEKEEVRQIYKQKGFKGKVLEEVVETITSNEKIWLDTMMAEELHIEPVNVKEVLRSAVIVTIATTIGHLIPLSPFFFVAHTAGLTVSIIISAIALFTVGVYEAVTLVGTWWKSGLRIVLIGMGSAFLGYLIATLFHVTTG